MVSDFKFFQDDETESYNGASWMFVRLENCDQRQYEIVEDYHYGIHSFLNEFPSWFIVSVLSISGSDGFEHNVDNDGVGWGFDITSDLINVKWVRFIN